MQNYAEQMAHRKMRRKQLDLMIQQADAAKANMKIIEKNPEKKIILNHSIFLRAIFWGLP